jgi:dsDNA-specific endonuclease/ATPase MutS2
MLLKSLENHLLYFDFIAGISNFISENSTNPIISSELKIINSKNIFLENPQPVTFFLDEKSKCSILTGANSGGKTTLIEHIIQIISLSQFGLPISGKITTPLFSEIYYFAKNKGSANKGAFETLLTQMSKIKPGNQTLILADEIEAVTEPGVAGKIIAATADYYIQRNCFLVIATHLGHEIKNFLPQKTRIDGIEAKGLTQNFELIVDHNPVLGRLAHSTPELIVEKMASQNNSNYFKYLNSS